MAVSIATPWTRDSLQNQGGQTAHKRRPRLERALAAGNGSEFIVVMPES